MSKFLTRQLAEQTFKTFIEPEVHRLAEAGVIKRAALALVVLDPTVPYTVGPDSELPVLFMGSVGASTWEKPYDVFAQAKAKISWRTGLSSRMVQYTMPHLIDEGDTVWWGSAILDGMITAASGVQPEYDEMFGLNFAGALRARTVALMRAFQDQQRLDNYSADFYQ